VHLNATKQTSIMLLLCETECAGMLLYGGRQQADDNGGDFLSLCLVNQRLQLRFNLGNGLTLIT